VDRRAALEFILSELWHKLSILSNSFRNFYEEFKKEGCRHVAYLDRYLQLYTDLLKCVQLAKLAEKLLAEEFLSYIKSARS
jgi:hypothetical protein